ncbi:Chain length determinant protein [Amycolatopsis marina]|uniref:Chain length determinant protein n=1 Tax=Amycolatopsis marina TaxID=490629 RepID=A0A1I0XAU8_9PSEU|nr:Wzz/FepE/Etk N-terminal domain-containing protein [Amycolatopsis marina]SFA98014.1 Chain length determinant protein [Amycolatopsis marina]
MSTGSRSESQPLLDLQRLLVTVRRRRRTWLSLGLLGLLLGAAVAVLLPAPPTAVTQLLVVHEDDQPSDGGSLMRTDIALLQTTRVATAALELLGSPERPTDFLKTYEGTAITGNVLQLTVKGSSDDDALARTTALAEAFIADHVQRVQAAADAEAKALSDQRDRLQKELSEVDSTIASTEAEFGTETAPQLETLYARRADLAAQVSELGRRADEAGIGAPRVAAGTQIVDAPRMLPGSLRSTVALNALIGLVLGLAAGLTLTAITGVVRDRPVLRREISAHLGASVVAQLSRPRRGPARLWRRSPGVTRRARTAATLARLVRENGTGGSAAVSLLDLGSPRTTADLALDIARALAADRPVTVVDDLPGQHLASRVTSAEPIRVVAFDDAAAGDGDTPAAGSRRRVGLGSVAPGTAWTDLRRLGGETLLVVRAGHANTAWLHTVARQLADSRIPIIGVVLVDPDPRDQSDGTLWDGLHTALRGRGAPAGGSAAPGGGNSNGNGGVVHDGDLPTKRFPPVGSAGLRGTV